MNKRKYEERSARSYQKIADHYDDSPEGRYTLEFKNLLLKSVQIPDGGQVLDVACGNGRLLEMLSRKYRFSGFGVDLSGKMVENAARLNPGMVFRQAGCDALPFENERFDVLTVCAAYHHFPDVAAFAKEAFRVLKSNGKLYIAKVYYTRLLRILCNPLFRFSPSGDVKLYGPEEILCVLENAGLKREREHFQGHIQMICVQK
ncbi:MAG TPA: methyltransferase domain-containing protein [Candidatus Limiplasma sp.]|nr:methyltransferase domain-containing protein [Candidatus Limiplasma sp.]